MSVWARDEQSGESLAITIGMGADQESSFVYLIIQPPGPGEEHVIKLLIEDLSTAEKLQIDVAEAVSGLKKRLQRR